MSGKSSTTVEYAYTGVQDQGSLGVSHQDRLKSAFPASPIYSQDQVNIPGNNNSPDVTLSHAGLKELYNDGILNGEVSSGNMFVEAVDMDYKEGAEIDPLLIEAVATGGEGKPGSPYGPNVASSPSVDASEQPEYLGELPDITQRNNFGSDWNGQLSPNVTRDKIANQRIGSYLLGKSTP